MVGGGVAAHLNEVILEAPSIFLRNVLFLEGECSGCWWDSAAYKVGHGWQDRELHL